MRTNYCMQSHTVLLWLCTILIQKMTVNNVLLQRTPSGTTMYNHILVTFCSLTMQSLTTGTHWLCTSILRAFFCLIPLTLLLLYYLYGVHAPTITVSFKKFTTTQHFTMCDLTTLKRLIMCAFSLQTVTQWQCKSSLTMKSLLQLSLCSLTMQSINMNTLTTLWLRRKSWLWLSQKTKLIFETNLCYESGARRVIFSEEKREVWKSHATLPSTR